jgi:hypothetical protein
MTCETRSHLNCLLYLEKIHFTDLKEYDPYTQDGNLTKGKIEFDHLDAKRHNERIAKVIAS